MQFKINEIDWGEVKIATEGNVSLILDKQQNGGAI